MIPLICTLAGPLIAQPQQAHSGRIDIYVVDQAFDLTNARGSRRARVTACSWLGEGKERTGVSCEKQLGNEWEEIWVEFTAEGAGSVDIDLQGEYYNKERPDDVRLVWADDVTVTGAEIQNASFEDVGADGHPAGWRFTAEFDPDGWSRDGSVASDGDSCIAVWWGSQARQVFEVEAGETYRVAALFRVIDPSKIQPPAHVPFECPVEMYEQDIEIEFASEDAADRASVEMLPLYDGHEWAISSRWDDNNAGGDRLVKAALVEHGHKGTFYLNQVGERFSGDVMRELMEGGFSIGGHGIGHPMLTYLNRNAIFEVVARSRADLEAAADTRINSYAFSFCNFRNSLEGDAVHVDITRALERGGYYNIANGWYHDAIGTDMILSPIMPWDGKPIRAYLESALVNDWHKDEHPNLSYAMHAWYDTPEEWKTFHEHLAMLEGNPDYWYCSQNEYAAYRFQLLKSTLSEPVREGSTLRFTLTRPSLVDVNDPTPLTFGVLGVPADAVTAVRCASADVRLSERNADEPRFSLAQDRDQALPQVVGLIHNRDNDAELADAGPECSGVMAGLRLEDGKLTVEIENGSDVKLSDVRYTFRLPLAWRNSVLIQAVPNIDPGIRAGTAADIGAPGADYKHRAGSAFFLAQVDFTHDGVAKRLHLACNAPPTPRDASYPQGGFMKLGPIPAGELDVDAVINGTVPESITLADGTKREWLFDDPNQAPYLDCEVIRTTGRWRTETEEPFYYLLRSTLTSEVDQEVAFRCVRGSIMNILVNGADALDQPAPLKEGANEMLIVYQAKNRAFGPEHAGCFIRTIDPTSNARVTNVAFQPS